MGGWMPYDRVMHRNRLDWQPEGEDLYPRGEEAERLDGYRSISMLIGDLRRMERDYLDPVYPQPPWATREEDSDPTAELSRACGVDKETCRIVLRALFRGAE